MIGDRKMMSYRMIWKILQSMTQTCPYMPNPVLYSLCVSRVIRAIASSYLLIIPTKERWRHFGLSIPCVDSHHSCSTNRLPSTPGDALPMLFSAFPSVYSSNFHFLPCPSDGSASAVCCAGISSRW